MITQKKSGVNSLCKVTACKQKIWRREKGMERRIQINLDLLGLKNRGFLANSNDLNYLTRDRSFEKVMPLKLFTQQLGVLILPALHLLSSSCKAFYILSGSSPSQTLNEPWSKARQKCRTREKTRPEAIDLGPCSLFPLAHFPWFWAVQCASEGALSSWCVGGGGQEKTVTSGCSFYLGCKSEYNTAHCINSKQVQADIQQAACPDQAIEQIKNKTV